MCRTLVILIAAGVLFIGLAVGQQEPAPAQVPTVPAPPRPPSPPPDDRAPQPRERRPGEGQPPGRFGDGGGPHGSDKLAANQHFVYVLRGDVLYQFNAANLSFVTKVKLPDPEPPRPRPGSDRPPPPPQ